MTSFVGRRAEVEQIKEHLGTTRLLTLTGVAGVGKTRLAVRVGAQVRRAYPDGVWLVELATVTDADLVAETVAQTLGIQQTDVSADPVDFVVGYLRSRRVLLILDNCEHLVEECALLATRLLTRTERAKVLATSREALRVAGEQILPIEPLQAGNGGTAVTLFADRAIAVSPGFTIADKRAQVATICDRLDGIPLAIELAAAQLRALSPDQLADRLDDVFRVLPTGMRSAMPHHRTLRAAIDWSFALCTTAERTIWARASVFASEFTLEAAEAICSGEGIAREDILPLLTSLVDKSVLLHTELSGYRMLETIRQYGNEQLRDSGDRVRLRRRHRDHFAELAEQGEREWSGPRQADWHARMVAAQANLRIALEYCVTEPGEELAALRLAASLWFHWLPAGFHAEAKYWLQRALAVGTEPTRERAKALWVSGIFAMLRGDLETCAVLLDEGHGLALRLGDEQLAAYLIAQQGMLAFFQSDLPRMAALLDDGLAHYRTLGMTGSHVLLAMISQASVAAFEGDPATTIARCAEIRAICEKRGDLWASAYNSYLVAMVERLRGEPARSAAATRDCLRDARRFHDLTNIAQGVEQLAWLAADQDEYGRAATLLGVSSEIWARYGASHGFNSDRWRIPHEECETRTRRALGDREFGAAFQRGVELTVEDGIAYALGEDVAPEATAPARPSPLTRRQQQVAELVAAGLSNKEIAERLVISRRTAEGHVEQILATLGFTSRTQIVAWFAEQET